MNRKTTIGLLITLSMASLSCEVDTKLRVEGGNPPDIAMSGNGTLSRLVIRGYKTLRRIDGPDSSAVWYIEIVDYEQGKLVSRLSPIAYGKTPNGYIQVYPEQGEAVLLEENVAYFIQVETWNANGASGFFIIRDGKTKFATHESELDKR